jgi:cyclomaltodextrinase
VRAARYQPARGTPSRLRPAMDGEAKDLAGAWAVHAARVPWAAPVAADRLRVRVQSGRGAFVRTLAVCRDRYGSEEIAVPMRRMGRGRNGLWWEGTLHLPTRRFAYRFCLEDRSGREHWLTPEGCRHGPPGDVWFEYPYIGDADLHGVPAWAEGAIVYHIFVDRFANGDPSNDPPDVQPWGAEPTAHGFAGGDLEGIRQHLSHLASLGVQILVLTPIFASPSNHRYDTRDYFSVDPALGQTEDLRSLVHAAHGLGIRVLLDGVFHHAGAGFAPFRDACARGPASPYWDWFRVHGTRIEMNPPNYETFAHGVAAMPKLLTHQPAVRDYLLRVATHWLETAGIDGWRLDVANEVDHAFWRAFRQAVRAVAPDALLVGEIWHDPMDFLDGSELDTVTGYPWRRSVLGLCSGHLDVAGFAAAMADLGAGMTPRVQPVAMNLLGSHDTPRVRTVLGGSLPRALLAAGLQLAWPGMPCIYYGDEIGMEGGGDPQCRRCMDWSPGATGQAALSRYRTLGSLRRTHRALARGGLRELHADRERSAYAFLRTHPQGDVLVAWNGGPSPWRPRWAVGLRRLDAAAPATDGPEGAAPSTVSVAASAREDGDSAVVPPLSVGFWAWPRGRSVPARGTPIRGAGGGLDWDGALDRGD